jgi:hypothetical protein
MPVEDLRTPLERVVRTAIAQLLGAGVPQRMVQVPRLEELLRRQGEPEDVRVSDVHPIPGGYSLVTLGFTASSSARTRRYVVRADPSGVGLTGTDRRSEWDLLQALTARPSWCLCPPWSSSPYGRCWRHAA